MRANARFIKVCASGGVGSEVDDPIHQQFSDEELRAIVEEAARADRIVAAHCHGKPGIMAALRAGVRTIEHGSYLDEEAADLMVARQHELGRTISMEEGKVLAEGVFEASRAAVTIETSARAGPTLCKPRFMGKLNGVIATTMPQGTRNVKPSLPAPPGAPNRR